MSLALNSQHVSFYFGISILDLAYKCSSHFGINWKATWHFKVKISLRLFPEEHYLFFPVFITVNNLQSSVKGYNLLLSNLLNSISFAIGHKWGPWAPRQTSQMGPQNGLRLFACWALAGLPQLRMGRRNGTWATSFLLLPQSNWSEKEKEAAILGAAALVTAASKGKSWHQQQWRR